MFCANCGSPITSNVSFCNRCGSSLRERSDSRPTGVITALLTAITLVAICGLGIMLAGSLVLRKGADLPVEFSAFFMFFTFIIVSMTEFMLIRTLSKLISQSHMDKNRSILTTTQPPLELHPPSVSPFGEPIGSVTDNTTRTLEYARREN